MHVAIFAPMGIEEAVEEVWMHDGREVARFAGGELRGGRREGFRSWTRHSLREGVGEYRVEVWTVSGQLLGEAAFEVTP